MVSIISFWKFVPPSAFPNNMRWKTNFQTSHMPTTDGSCNEGPLLMVDGDVTKQGQVPFLSRKTEIGKFFIMNWIFPRREI